MKLPNGDCQPSLHQFIAQADILRFFRLFILFLFHIPQAVLHGFATLAEFLDAVSCGFDICVIRLCGLHSLETAGGLFSTSICWKIKA